MTMLTHFGHTHLIRLIHVSRHTGCDDTASNLSFTFHAFTFHELTRSELSMNHKL